MHLNEAQPNTSTNDTAHVASAGRTDEQSSTDRGNCAASEITVASGKAFETMRAKLAMRGFELHIVDDGEGGAAYLVRRWSMSRTLPDLATVQAFAEKVGASHA